MKLDGTKVRTTDPEVCAFVIHSIKSVIEHLQNLERQLTPLPAIPKPVELDNRECMLRLIREMSESVLMGDWKQAKSQCGEILEELILLEHEV